MSTQGKTDIPVPQAPSPHPGYAPHAALQAIKRHAVELMSQKEMVSKVGLCRGLCFLLPYDVIIFVVSNTEKLRFA